MIRKTPRGDLAAQAREVTRFDRFYSRRLRHATKAARVNEANDAERGIFLELLEGPCPPGWLCWRLDLDAGHLARRLRKLELEGHLTVRGSDVDRRMRQVTLTDLGRAVARSLARFQEDTARKALEELPARNQRRLVRAMQAIIEILQSR